MVAADAIHVLKAGAVVESGSHRQLLEAGGAYASMAAKQAMRFDEEGEEEGGEAKGEGGAGAGEAASARAKATPRRLLRESVLRRGSVRLSVIPQALVDKLAGGKADGEGGSEGAPSGFRRLAALNRPEWAHGALGLLCALAVGLQVRAAWDGLAGVTDTVLPVACTLPSCSQYSCLRPTSPADARLLAGAVGGGVRPLAARPR